jgi:exonuclease SbcC
MDYRTFTASAFFVQGRSDDFLRMRPEGRREVFSQLLGLEAYERLAEAARLRARDASSRRAEHARRAVLLAGAPAELVVVEKEVDVARATLVRSTTDADAAKARLDDVRADLLELEKVEVIITSEREQLSVIDSAIEQFREQIAARQSDLAGIDDLLARGDEARDAVAELHVLRSADEEARQRQIRASELERKKTQIAERIEGERKAISMRHHANTVRLKALTKETGDLDKLERKLREIEQRLRESSDPRPAIGEVRVQLDDANRSCARLEEQLRSIDAHVAEVKEKTELIACGGGECPICGTTLDAAHRAKVKRSLQSDEQEWVREGDSVRAGLATARKESARTSEELERLEKALGEHEKLTATATELLARLDRRTSLEAQIATARREVELDGNALRDDAFEAELRSALSEIEAELGELYDPAEHERIRARIGELRLYESLEAQIKQAAGRRDGIAREVEDAHARLAATSGKRESRLGRIAELEVRVAPIVALRERVGQTDADYAAALSAATAAESDLARLLERLEGATRSVAELCSAKGSETEAAAEHRRYQRLAEAFGRNGIPQRIIENERPQLEHEANRILGRLCDDPMTVHLQFHRETKSGKTRETLEIVVRPHDGDPRDFAMFSGGEAFRIAFAVRLAMSKLLVRRAGARLETLVIDEGFGSQDPQGRERLIEAINLARGEFRKVLVITHLEDLKDQFGAQVVVTKGPDGSTFRLEPA